MKHDNSIILLWSNKLFTICKNIKQCIDSKCVVLCEYFSELILKYFLVYPIIVDVVKKIMPISRANKNAGDKKMLKIILMLQINPKFELLTESKSAPSDGNS